MELTLTFDDAQHLLRATYNGPYTLDEANATFLTILEAVVKHKAKRVLVDACRVTGEPNTSERFAYSQYIAQAVFDLSKQGFSPLPRFAYVMVEPLRDRECFGETVAVNRGMPVKVFGNLADAEQWLNQPQVTLL